MGFNLSFRSWISINGYDWLRWPAFVRQPQVKVLWICYSATISQYTLSGKASLGIAVLSYWRSSYESGGFTLTGLLKSPCYGLFEYLPSSEGYSNLSFLYSTRYCAEHSQKPWPSAMLDPPLEVQWWVSPELVISVWLERSLVQQVRSKYSFTSLTQVVPPSPLSYLY